MNDSVFGEVISSYDREQALEDGVYIDISAMAKEAGIRFPVAITSNLYHKYVVPSEKAKTMGQSIDGRLWDVLTMFRFAAKNTKGSKLSFKVIFQDGVRDRKIIEILSVCGPISATDSSPAISIYLLEDD